MSFVTNTVTNANRPSSCWVTACRRPATQAARARSASINRCRKSLSASGYRPNNCAASVWHQRWRYGCRITTDTMAGCCPVKRSFWSRSARRRWTACWPRAKVERCEVSVGPDRALCCANFNPHHQIVGWRTQQGASLRLPSRPAARLNSLSTSNNGLKSFFQNPKPKGVFSS